MISFPFCRSLFLSIMPLCPPSSTRYNIIMYMISAFDTASITAIPWYKGEWSCEICCWYDEKKHKWSIDPPERPYICFPPRPTATTTISTNTAAAVPHLLHNGASLIFMGKISKWAPLEAGNFAPRQGTPTTLTIIHVVRSQHDRAWQLSPSCWRNCTLARLIR